MSNAPGIPEGSQTWHADLSREQRVSICRHIMTKLMSYYKTAPVESLKERTSSFEANTFTNSNSYQEYLHSIADCLSRVEKLINNPQPPQRRPQGNLQPPQPQPSNPSAAAMPGALSQDAPQQIQNHPHDQGRPQDRLLAMQHQSHPVVQMPSQPMVPHAPPQPSGGPGSRSTHPSIPQQGQPSPAQSLQTQGDLQSHPHSQNLPPQPPQQALHPTKQETSRKGQSGSKRARESSDAKKKASAAGKASGTDPPLRKVPRVPMSAADIDAFQRPVKVPISGAPPIMNANAQNANDYMASLPHNQAIGVPVTQTPQSQALSNSFSSTPQSQSNPQPSLQLQPSLSQPGKTPGGVAAQSQSLSSQHRSGTQYGVPPQAMASEGNLHQDRMQSIALLKNVAARFGIDISMEQVGAMSQQEMKAFCLHLMRNPNTGNIQHPSGANRVPHGATNNANGVDMPPVSTGNMANWTNSMANPGRVSGQGGIGMLSNHQGQHALANEKVKELHPANKASHGKPAPGAANSATAAMTAAAYAAGSKAVRHAQNVAVASSNFTPAQMKAMMSNKANIGMLGQERPVFDGSQHGTLNQPNGQQMAKGVGLNMRGGIPAASVPGRPPADPEMTPQMAAAIWRRLDQLRSFKPGLTKLFPLIKRLQEMKPSDKLDMFVKRMSECLHILSLNRSQGVPPNITMERLKSVENFMTSTLNVYTQYLKTVVESSGAEPSKRDELLKVLDECQPNDVNNGGVQRGKKMPGLDVQGRGGAQFPSNHFPGHSNVSGNKQQMDMLKEFRQHPHQTPTPTQRAGSNNVDGVGKAGGGRKKGGGASRASNAAMGPMTVKQGEMEAHVHNHIKKAAHTKVLASEVPVVMDGAGVRGKGIPAHLASQGLPTRNGPQRGRTFAGAPGRGKGKDGSMGGNWGGAGEGVPHPGRGVSVEQRIASMEENVREASDLTVRLESFLEAISKREKSERIHNTLAALRNHGGISGGTKRYGSIGEVDNFGKDGVVDSKAVFECSGDLGLRLAKRPKNEAADVKSLREAVEADCRAAKERNPLLMVEVLEEFGQPVVTCLLNIAEIRLPKLVLRVQRGYPRKGGATYGFERPAMGWVGVVDEIRTRFKQALATAPAASVGVAAFLDAWAREADAVINGSRLSDAR